MIIRVCEVDKFGETYRGEKLSYDTDQVNNLRIYNDQERIGIHAAGRWINVKTMSEDDLEPKGER